LKSYRGSPCVICGAGSNPCHIQSVGAGGPDQDDNLIAMCFWHHRLQHDIGWGDFVDRFPLIGQILDGKGWELVDCFGKRKLMRK
jgi:hypothetical protein